MALPSGRLQFTALCAHVDMLLVSEMVWSHSGEMDHLWGVQRNDSSSPCNWALGIPRNPQEEQGPPLGMNVQAPIRGKYLTPQLGVNVHDVYPSSFLS